MAYVVSHDDMVCSTGVNEEEAGIILVTTMSLAEKLPIATLLPVVVV